MCGGKRRGRAALRRTPHVRARNGNIEVIAGQDEVYEQTLPPGPFKDPTGMGARGPRQAAKLAGPGRARQSIGRDAATGRLISIKTLRERFEEKCIIEPNGCWTWTGTSDRDGYGMLWHGQRHIRATHASLLITGWPVPKGKYACHTCDNPRCVNPAHLFVGTAKENQQDSLNKGRRNLRATDGEKHPNHKLTMAQVLYIRSSKERGVVLAARYGVDQSLISAIRKRKKWAHV